jgi:hypothetical protein
MANEAYLNRGGGGTSCTLGLKAINLLVNIGRQTQLQESTANPKALVPDPPRTSRRQRQDVGEDISSCLSHIL